jgi:hypothetical protein
MDFSRSSETSKHASSRQMNKRFAAMAIVVSHQINAPASPWIEIAGELTLSTHSGPWPTSALGRAILADSALPLLV